MIQTVSIIITGKVQGVFYRQSTKEKADALGIKGEVKNMPDESVHIIATGDTNQIQELVEWSKQGPSRARITNVFVEEITLKEFARFSIVR